MPHLEENNGIHLPVTGKFLNSDWLMCRVHHQIGSRCFDLLFLLITPINMASDVQTDMPHFFTFSLQIPSILHGYGCQQWNPAYNGQTISFKSMVFCRVVCHQLHCMNTEISKYLPQ